MTASLSIRGFVVGDSGDFNRKRVEMIEALIRDDKRLKCIVIIEDAPDKDSLNVDIFLLGQGKTLSGVMPGGGEPAVRVARAIMTVYPVSALPKLVDSESRHPLYPAMNKDSAVDLRPASQQVRERKAGLYKEMAELDKRADKIAADIENLRKSHLSDPLGDRPKWP